MYWLRAYVTVACFHRTFIVRLTTPWGWVLCSLFYGKNSTWKKRSILYRHFLVMVIYFLLMTSIFEVPCVWNLVNDVNVQRIENKDFGRWWHGRHRSWDFVFLTYDSEARKLGKSALKSVHCSESVEKNINHVLLSYIGTLPRREHVIHQVLWCTEVKNYFLT